MIDRLARLADRRGRRVVLIAALFFVLAGALGAGVADRLDPYGAEDPSTESVIVDQRLEDAGYRSTEVVVLISDADPTSAAGARRVEEVERRIAGDPGVASVTGFAETRSRAFVSRDGDSTYLAVGLETTDDDETQDVAERIAASLEDEPGVSVGGSAVAQAQVNEQVESDLRQAELLAFPLLFLLSLLFFRSLV
ncbi:MAG: MMPL family transporter, partial [Solirubrobacterales bacterium]